MNQIDDPEISAALDLLFDAMMKQADKEGVSEYHAFRLPVSRMGVGPRLTCHLDMKHVNKDSRS